MGGSSLIFDLFTNKAQNKWCGLFRYRVSRSYGFVCLCFVFDRTWTRLFSLFSFYYFVGLRFVLGPVIQWCMWSEVLSLHKRTLKDDEKTCASHPSAISTKFRMMNGSCTNNDSRNFPCYEKRIQWCDRWGIHRCSSSGGRYEEETVESRVMIVIELTCPSFLSIWR